MTPAETLREAARLMRERAQAATPGPWVARHHPGLLVGYAQGPSPRDENGFSQEHMGRVLPGYGGTVYPWDAAHIASWHPAVALAVADWLEVTARDVGTSSLSFHSAIAVARAYLGEAS